MNVDWQEIQDAWFEAVLTAVSSTATANPGAQFYAGAFWLLYGDYSTIHVPVFGLNSETSDTGIRWHPPDWEVVPYRRRPRAYGAAVRTPHETRRVLGDLRRPLGAARRRARRGVTTRN